MVNKDNEEYFLIEIAYEETEGLLKKMKSILYDGQAPLILEKKLDLIYVAEDAPPANLCMANSEEVRDEFRTTFSKPDFKKYIVGWLQYYRSKEDKCLNSAKVPFPHSINNFWMLVKEGQNHQNGK